MTKTDTDGGWSLTYDTPITDDVIGHLNDEEAAVFLFLISRLRTDGTFDPNDDRALGVAVEVLR